MPEVNELTKLERRLTRARQQRNARALGIVVTAVFTLVIGGLYFPLGGRLFNWLLPVAAGVGILNELLSALLIARLERKITRLKGLR